MSYTPIVQKLVDYLESKPEIRAEFERSLKDALSYDLKVFRDYGIETLDDYLGYMDKYVNWIPTEDFTGRNVVQHICVFYFVIDLPPVNKHQNPIDPSVTPPYLWLSQWLIDYAKAMGAWMDTPESITKESIASFYTADNYHMKDYPVPKGGWKTFNEFFARHINPAARPIAPDTSNEVVIVNPADSAFDDVWSISEDTAEVTFPDKEAEKGTFYAKGIPWSISQLLFDTEHGPRFAGGLFTHSFLAPSDYHRQHAPVSGTVVEAKIIPGLCYLEVVYKPGKSPSAHGHLEMFRAMRPAPVIYMTPDNDDGGEIQPPNSPGYQFLQARGLILIDNPDLGLVAVLPIGMAQVSSVVLSVKKGDVLKKGDEISYFQFGGSDVIMVFEKAANVTFHQEHNKHYNFGTRVATAPKKATAPKAM